MAICANDVNFCEVLVARLDASGEVLPGTDSLYVTDQGIQMSVAPVLETGTRTTKRNGCGNICASIPAPCSVTLGYTLGLQLCKNEIELEEMLLNGVIETISDGGTGEVNIGYQDPDPNAACGNGVLIEAYDMAWNGDEPYVHPVTGLAAYWRHRFPKVLWVRGSDTLAQGIRVHNYTGDATSNSAAGLGPFCTWPAVVGGPYAKDLISIDELPSVACGYQDLAACAS